VKKETYANKLAELLGIQDVVDTSAYSDKPIGKRSKRFAGLSESEITKYREGTALYYFFQAPELFQPRICAHCEAPFLVSRHQVALCSYDCLEREIEKIAGVKWSRHGDMELMVKEVYDGNEPLIIKNLDRINKVLDQANQLNTADSVGV
jgi:hypothetical protein